MIHVITDQNTHLYPKALDTMFRDRKTIFVDHLHWNVPVIDGVYEQDQFDLPNAVYLVAVNPDDGTHLGSMRLLPTTAPHILGDIFPHLCDRAVPRANDILEVTRFIISPKIKDRHLYRSVRGQLGLGMTEYALLNGIKSFTACAHASWLSSLSSVGWKVSALGNLQQVDSGQPCGAIKIDIDQQTLQILRGLNKLTKSVIVSQHIEAEYVHQEAA